MIIRPYEARDFEAVFTLVETTLRELGFGENVGEARRDLENIATGDAGARALQRAFYGAALEEARNRTITAIR